MAGLLEAYPTTHLWLVVLLLLGVLWICLKGATGTRKVPATGFPVIKLKSNDMEPGIIEGSKLVLTTSCPLNKCYYSK